MNSEHWPIWVLYVPVWIQHFWLSMKVGNLFFFLRTNPSIDGFILSDSKFNTLQLVPEAYRPKSIQINESMSLSEVKDQMQFNDISFPVVLKPDIGYRGLKVLKIDDNLALENAVRDIGTTFLLQEFIDHSLEIGLFYYRFPNREHGVIPSLTIKNFLTVTGNGKQTLGKLVGANPRALRHLTKLEKNFGEQWNEVIQKNRKIILEPIGNHNRGTEFRNANHLVNENLCKVFDQMSAEMPGFYFGRFDIKTPSLDHLMQEKEFKVLEINGVGGEPTHIYDPQSTFINAWRDLCHVWRTAAKIAQINFQQGVPKPSFAEAYTKWKAYYNYRSKLA